jgi:hypothetical protein
MTQPRGWGLERHEHQALAASTRQPLGLSLKQPAAALPREALASPTDQPARPQLITHLPRSPM